MKAKKKPIDTLTLDALNVKITPNVKYLKVVEPPKRQAGKKVESVDELLDKLKNEAKVI
jgi:electron transfer flavoprotein beta subunit